MRAVCEMNETRIPAEEFPMTYTQSHSAVAVLRCRRGAAGEALGEGGGAAGRESIRWEHHGVREIDAGGPFQGVIMMVWVYPRCSWSPSMPDAVLMMCHVLDA